MLFVNPKDIRIAENRQRMLFDPDALQDLIDSISARGLLHAPVVRTTPNGLELVAGERRYRAMSDMLALGYPIHYAGAVCPPDAIPVTDIGDLSDLDAEEAQLDENLKRSDLTWQERSAAIARLHRLRTAQAEAIGSTQLLGDTATEVFGYADGSRTAAVSSSLILDQHLLNPLVAKAKTAKDAIKILKREEATAKHTALSEVVGRTFTSAIHSLHHSDCLSWMAETPEKFDVILTDPPYGMGADSFGDAGGLLAESEHHYADDLSHWRELMGRWCGLAYTITKPQAHAYVFCDIDNFAELRELMRGAGWKVFRTPLVNHKPRGNRMPWPEQGPKRRYELILYAVKGNRPVTGVYSDVIESVMTEENLAHGAQKPVSLYVDLLKRSIRPGDTVLDCFAGTGTIFPAAHSVRCKAVGVEQSAEYYGIAVSRLNALDDEPEIL